MLWLKKLLQRSTGGLSWTHRFRCFYQAMKKLLSILAVACACIADAATYTVTTAADGIPAPVGSLRWAITAANTNSNVDEIWFQIPGGHRRRINLVSGLGITQPVRIYGSTQSGYLRSGRHSPQAIELKNQGGPGGTCFQISGNYSEIYGLAVSGYSTPFFINGNSNLVEDCFIGVTADGRYSGNDGVTPGGVGVQLGGIGNRIVNNVISGSTGHGLLLAGSRHVVAGNLIGLDSYGDRVIGNAGNGILVEFGFNISIGGSNALDGNFICGSESHGIQLGISLGATNILIQNNVIGANTDFAPAGNAGHGIFVNRQRFVRVLNNSIVANRGHGVFLFGISPASTCDHCDIVDNRIGLTPKGSRMGNWGDGISLASGNSAHSITGNHIEDNSGNGIQFFDSRLCSAAWNQIHANEGAGIYLEQSFGIVDTITLTNNNITDQSGPGIVVRGNAVANWSSRNQIHGNGKLGIDIGGTRRAYTVQGSFAAFDLPLTFTNYTCDGNGVTTNGTVGRPSPVTITSATVTNTQVQVRGWLNPPLQAFSTYRIEFYRNFSCDASGYGEGRDFLFETNVVFNGPSATNFTATFSTGINPEGVRPGQYVAATVIRTDALDSSEFSACTQFTGVGNRAPQPQPDTSNTQEDTPVTINVLANDTEPDGQSMQVTGTTPPYCGQLVINPNNTITYTPKTNFYGRDSFSYTVSDGNGGEASATVTVIIAGVNDDLPVGQQVFEAIEKDTSFKIGAVQLFKDPDNQQLLNFNYATQPDNGQAVIAANPPTVTYTPNNGYTGYDSFTVKADDFNSGMKTLRLRFYVQDPQSTNVDLEVTQHVTQNTNTTGAQVTYWVTVKNNGPATATDVYLLNRFPPGSTLVSYPNSHGTASAGPTAIANAIGTLAPGATATLTVTVTANHIGDSVNEAKAWANEPDSNPDNNLSRSVAHIVSDPDFVAQLKPTLMQNGQILLQWPASNNRWHPAGSATLPGLANAAQSIPQTPVTVGDMDQVIFSPVGYSSFFKLRQEPTTLIPYIKPQIIPEGP